MSETSNGRSAAGGVSLSSMLGLLFIGLKLGGVIHWSWLWVLAPFWIPSAVFLFVVLPALLMALGVKAVAEERARKRRIDAARMRIRAKARDVWGD